jgi:hypothetical protein
LSQIVSNMHLQHDYSSQTAPEMVGPTAAGWSRNRGRVPKVPVVRLDAGPIQTGLLLVGPRYPRPSGLELKK